MPVGNGPMYGTANDNNSIPSKSAVPNNFVKYAMHITNADTANIRLSDVNEENSKINLYNKTITAAPTNQNNLILRYLTSSTLKNTNIANMPSSRYNELEWKN